LWCETRLRVDSKVCPECGLHSPILQSEGNDRGTAPRRRSRSLGLGLALVVVPLMLSVAYAAHLQAIAESDSGESAAAAVASVTAPAPAPAPAFYDGLQRSVWSDGVKSVQAALSNPSFTQFGGSFISVSEGHIVSFCGSLPGTAGYGGPAGEQRFISIFGQRYATVLETGDGSFDVLWTRVCSTPTKAA